MEFPRPEYCSGQPFPSPGNLPNPGIEPRSSTLQADFSPAEPPGGPRILPGTLPGTDKLSIHKLELEGLLRGSVIKTPNFQCRGLGFDP